MKKIQIADMQASQIILGCMRIIEPGKNPVKVIETAYENGINFFDHADIYGAGQCETVFAEALAQTSIRREDIYLQSKCAIRPGVAFDFSKEHIIKSVEGSLQRLQTDYLDTLLLHRPDTLMEPEEVAEAFHELEKSGKVRYFGVSNQNPMQVELLKTAVKQPLLFNQLQFGLKHTEMIDAGLNVNIPNQASHMQDGSVLEYSRINKMTIQAWSPFQHGYFDGPFVGNDKFPELNKKLEEYAEKYNLTPSGIAIAWINRHPAGMQTIIGTMTEQRILEVTNASDLVLSRNEWYDLYMAAGNILP
ncbi:aldo/keto reductase [Lactococcus formosensis]|jgi:Predicted oxidoreductase|uniref:Aldo/keto reductase n=1 Tax=Lactococcus formosensis TaxID=1281486 RepID=A0A9X4NYV9_9LACT|nr:aldo/keto reductase [Lactococcus formosensis]NHI72575.1 aldo/keto reductase family oxidoreductase [Lactococcus garvieae]MCH1722581.1 aldo/keto reductase [Lactococcus formosensis]MCO7179973.1 aldo/keto reductase [Lactococcus formosensis]MDG6111667.1 aldo/keto reductase [Lactococcus formosensis]MDG6113218.1 aldo/keto reductase [Lactococcus formosensis]